MKRDRPPLTPRERDLLAIVHGVDRDVVRAHRYWIRGEDTGQLSELADTRLAIARELATLDRAARGAPLELGL